MVVKQKFFRSEFLPKDNSHSKSVSQSQGTVKIDMIPSESEFEIDWRVGTWVHKMQSLITQHFSSNFIKSNVTIQFIIL